ncbi:HAD-IIIA family hydrolase [Owenweeksia hongkongensis]|uniref:HAD-IIIA family hydrolase n=1 Tax=Owenweeksia hongkongensis TaxID=253245 RepID=UPI003A8D3A57
MKVVILAGGRGTRLGELTKDIPKPMVPLLGKPLLQYQIELLVRYGFSEVILIVNHLSQPIKDHFGDGADFGIKICYYQEEKPLGTVGGIKDLEAELTEDFLVLYGDVMMEMDLNRLVNFHKEKGSQATLVVHPNDHPYDSDLVEMNEEGLIVDVLPKPHSADLIYHNMVNAAVYILSPAIFPFLEKGKKADFGKDIFPRVFADLKMYGYNTPEYLKDMGTPDRLEHVGHDVQSGKVKRRNLENRQKAIFLDRDGVINENVDLIHKPEDFHLYPFTARAISKINTSDYLAVVTTNQSVVARNLTTVKGLGEIHKKMETELGDAGAKLDAIYYCPHHPDKGYPEENVAYKIDCDCRKPKPGMINNASRDYNIDPSQSFMIGDSEADMGAGKAAGCTTVGVMTGFGLRKAKTKPDYLFANLEEAANFIVDEPYKDLAAKVKDLVSTSTKETLVINIGGNTRSGKSTLATYLQKQLKADGIDCLRITLDHWILPKSERIGKEEVFHNFQIDKLESDVQSIINGKTIELKGYTPHPDYDVEDVTYKLEGQKVILIEGVVALATENLRNLSDLKIFKNINEDLLKQRMFTYYDWKGYSEESIQVLWETRKPNEYDLIAQNEQFSDLVV